MNSKRRVAAGGFDRFTKELVFTATFEECEMVDFYDDWIIPSQYAEKVESNEIIYFYVADGEVKASMFRWEEGSYKLDGYGEVEKEIREELKKRKLI